MISAAVDAGGSSDSRSGRVDVLVSASLSVGAIRVHSGVELVGDGGVVDGLDCEIKGEMDAGKSSASLKL